MQSFKPQDVAPPPRRPLRFLTELEPWHRAFLSNLADTVLLRMPQPVRITARPAPFWPDVFVDASLPRRGILQSALWHTLLLVSVYAVTRAWPPAPAHTLDPFRNRSITYYNVSEYLPPIDSGSEPAPVAHKGEPAFARQKVISLPRNADNSRQTIVDPSTVRILHEPRPMPNVVAWTAPAPAVPITGLAHSRVSIPTPDLSVIAPPVQTSARDLARMRLDVPVPQAVNAAVQAGPRNLAKLNLPAVPAPGAVEPAPSADATHRNLGDLNIGRYTPTVAAPRLQVAEQRSTGAGGAPGAVSSQPPAPAPPSLGGVGNSRQASGRLIALGLDPAAVSGPIALPGGNRSGVFAASPEGKPGAPGTPDIAGGGKGPGGQGRGDAGPGAGPSVDIPAGLLVAGGMPTPLVAVVAAPAVAPPPPPPPAPVNRPVNAARVFASLPSTRVSDIARQTAPNRTDAPKIQDEVFGAKKFYTMSLNMPNLTSAAGTWVIRFAELNETRNRGDLTAPVATIKVDPAYPPQLIREHVEGTVTLYAIIRADGTVGEVKVLHGVDQQLDENAKVALSRWHFRPATKNGSAVDLEAVVQIPFRSRKITF